MIVLVPVVIAALVVGALVGFVARTWSGLDGIAPVIANSKLRQEVQQHRGLRALLRARIDPQKLTSFGLSAAIVGIVTALFLTGILLIMVNNNAGVARWDLAATRFGADNAGPSAAAWLRRISWFGGTPFMLLVAVGISAVEARRRRLGQTIGLLVTALVGQSIIVNLTKLLVNRPRPNVRRLTSFAGSSFPSGHAATAIVTFACIALFWGRRAERRTRPIIAGGSMGCAAAVATSRVLLGVHWLTDVLAGCFVGAAWFGISAIAFGGSRLRFGQPVEVAESIAENTDVQFIDEPGERHT